MDPCTCQTGYFWSWYNSSCVPCDPSVDCDDPSSLSPPNLRPGFWATTAGLVIAQNATSTFAGHSVYRCYNEKTCSYTDYGPTICPPSRTGLACGLCIPGYSGGPGGPCLPCGALTPTLARINLFVAGPFIIFVVIMLCHLFFNAEEDEADNLQTAPRTWKVILQPGLFFLQQILNYFQVLGIISSSPVKWSPAIRSSLRWAGMVSSGAFDETGISCLMESGQTVWLEMGFRWLFPPCVSMVALFTPIMAVPIGMVLQKFIEADLDMGVLSRMYLRAPLLSAARRLKDLGVGSSLQVLALISLIWFNATLVYNGLALLTCPLSPNGKRTVLKWPHLECDPSNPEFAALLGPCIAYLCLVVIGLFVLRFFAWRRTVWELAHSRLKHRGPWRQIFEMYRDSHLHWILLVGIRDFLINLVAALLSSETQWQMVLFGLVMLSYSVMTLLEQPHKCPTNNSIDFITSVCIVTICLVSAASPDSSDWLLQTVQWLGVSVPAGLTIVYIIGSLQRTRCVVPPFLRPLTSDWRAERSRYLAQVTGIRGQALEFFDDVDFDTFDRQVASSTAFLLTMDEEDEQRPADPTSAAVAAASDEETFPGPAAAAAAAAPSSWMPSGSVTTSRLRSTIVANVALTRMTKAKAKEDRELTTVVPISVAPRGDKGPTPTTGVTVGKPSEDERGPAGARKAWD